jgi:dinuclear metal center YbgI/SA1388 family protein
MDTLRIKEISRYLERLAPLSFQESYDNSGLLIGDQEKEIKSALITLDVTSEVLQEAKDAGAGLIIAHHPLIFSGLKKLTGTSSVERIVLKAIQENIAIYAAHTNMDAIPGGVNSYLCEKLNLKNIRVLRPLEQSLFKLVTFIPETHLELVRESLFDAGAGSIGNYDQCSFTLAGTGSFRGGENTHPFVGQKGKLHFENEIRLETVFPAHLKKGIIHSLTQSHPYEEVAYDIYPLANKYEMAGMGLIGELRKAMGEKELLEKIKLILGAQVIKHTAFLGENIKTIAVCGGAGSFLLNDAIKQHADIFISGDFKYHEFFNAENKILIADAGHYETEHHVKDVFYELLKEKFPTFAFRISEVNTNPVKFI